MPILGLTDRAESFLRLGKIKKGDKDEKGYPRDLDYFRLIFSYGCEDVEKQFRLVYGDKPTRINMRLAFPDIQKVWDAFYVAYEKGGMLACAGSNENGFYWVWYRDHGTKEVLVRNGRAVGPRGEEFISQKIDVTQPIYSYKNKDGENVPVYLEPEGRLSIVIPEMATIDGRPRVGFFEFCPGSPRDIGTISSELAAIDLWAKQVGKDITGIPMVLTRRKEMITKNIKGVLSQGPSWVVHIEVSGQWGGKALDFMQMKALPEFVDAEVQEIEPEFVEEENHNTPVVIVQSPPEPIHEEHDSPLLKEKPAEKAKKVEKEDAPKRPYPPLVFREKLQKIISDLPGVYEKDGLELIATEHERKVLASCIDTIFGDKGVSRHPVCTWLVGKGTTNDMDAATIQALFLVMGIKNTAKHPAQFNDPPSAESIQEFKMAYEEATKK